jgi:hypothetical protein
MFRDLQFDGRPLIVKEPASSFPFSGERQNAKIIATRRLALCLLIAELKRFAEKRNNFQLARRK